MLKQVFSIRQREHIFSISTHNTHNTKKGEKMLKVLLVDDEPFILQGLSVIIDWQNEGFEIVGKVENVKDALKIIKDKNPELIIADIKMPEQTGLDLLQIVREELKLSSYFVILSGFNDFSYVRQALRNDCLDYMLKPVNKTELLKVLAKVRELNKDYCQKQKDELRQEKALFSRNIIPLIFGKFDSQNLEHVKKYLGHCKGCRYISVELNLNSPKIAEASEEQKHKMQRELYQKCLNFMKGFEYRVIYNVENSRYDVGIIYSDDLLLVFNAQNEQSYLQNLKENLIECVDFEILLIAGSKVSDLSVLSQSAKTAIMSRTFSLFEYSSLEKVKNEYLHSENQKQISKDFLDELIHSVELNQNDKIKENVKKLNEIIQLAEVSLVNMATNYIIFALIHLAQMQDPNVDQQKILQSINDDANEQIFSFEGESGEKFLLQYGEYLAQLRGNQAKGVLAQIEEDIKKNFMENLTLKDFSQKYFLNAAYLVQIFKIQYGESFKDFLNRVRIENACQLLLQTDKKVYEIADEIGYKDLDYFINKFISFYGCTPTKFRKQNVK